MENGKAKIEKRKSVRISTFKFRSLAQHKNDERGTMNDEWSHLEKFTLHHSAFILSDPPRLCTSAFREAPP
jgi:hypothetical protein